VNETFKALVDNGRGLFIEATMSRRLPRRGFTLIELITVMAILGITGVVVVGGTLSYLGEIRSRAAASRLTADIRYVQRTALASGLRTWVVFNIGQNSYQLFIENASNPGKANRAALVRPVDQSSAEMTFGDSAFSGVSITSANINSTTELEFDSFGAPYDGNSVALTANAVVRLSNGVTATIVPVTGFVERTG
jgi:prepilin-type N-terminal cleavage/methylation domain-containing protein